MDLVFLVVSCGWWAIAICHEKPIFMSVTKSRVKVNNLCVFFMIEILFHHIIINIDFVAQKIIR